MLVRTASIADGAALDAAVRQLDPVLFGSGDAEDDSPEQKSIYRVAKRLAKYTRRVRFESQASGKKMKINTANVAKKTIADTTTATLPNISPKNQKTGASRLRGK